MTVRPHHDVLVVGGGNAGISLAAKLRRDGYRDVAIIEPSTVHHYRPMLSYVGSGLATLDELRRPEAAVIPAGCRWYTDRVTAVEPDRSRVRLARIGTLTYDDLVVCPGSSIDWEAVPGSREAVSTPAASTNYEVDLAPRTWAMLSALTRGRAVFTLSQWQVPCAPVALKPLFMAADHWSRTGVLGDIEIELLVEGARLVDEDRADRELRAAADRYGVRVRLGTNLESIDAPAQVARVRSADRLEDLGYDALHLTPPHRAPDWVAASGLAGRGTRGFMAVDPRTLRHPAYPSVWGLGDVAAADALPSGGALRKQVPVVAHNITAGRSGGAMRSYSGYSVAPVTTSRRRLLLAEFDRDGEPEPTTRHPDLVRPRAATFAFDRYVEPLVYWRRLLRGHVS
ncbi:NAD(P)/FAD-dependent oxidoreductase [Georgenia faecalis]|uniref:FAD-dependent oxidoreductase n=1 Tax=Georgenia faecalis TaxID=2483799 RepID=A0ABV9D8D0_9MICO|nr:FAD/NAD(P)-binding oxidoreductase [Georgenia faecalis]